MPDEPLPPHSRLAAEALRRGKAIRRKRQYARRGTMATIVVAAGVALAVTRTSPHAHGPTPAHNGTSTTFQPHLPPAFKWSKPKYLSLPYQNSVSVSCASPVFCVAVSDQADVSRFNGASWTPPVLLARGHVHLAAGGSVSVSCASSSFCVAVDGGLAGSSQPSGVTNDGAFLFDGRSWRPSRMKVDGNVQSVSCTTTHFCAAVDGSGNAITFNGSRWSQPKMVNPWGLLNDVSCTGRAFCVAVGSGRNGNAGEIVTYEGTSWSAQAAPLLGEPTSVSCPSPSFCAVIDTNGQVETFDGKSWGLPKNAVAAGGQWAYVSCASASFCVAASNHTGETATFDGSTWSGKRIVAGFGFMALSCPTPSYCAATNADNWIHSMGGVIP